MGILVRRLFCREFYHSPATSSSIDRSHFGNPGGAMDWVMVPALRFRRGCDNLSPSRHRSAIQRPQLGIGFPRCWNFAPGLRRPSSQHDRFVAALGAMDPRHTRNRVWLGHCQRHEARAAPLAIDPYLGRTPYLLCARGIFRSWTCPALHCRSSGYCLEFLAAHQAFAANNSVRFAMLGSLSFAWRSNSHFHACRADFPLAVRGPHCHGNFGIRGHLSSSEGALATFNRLRPPFRHSHLQRHSSLFCDT
ncbi:MAG: hypothetical protein JWM88_1892 [Verrucomicrobia bacterium]|nr:hypothetical protein [Verrucomicrobiota bacterium]